MIFAVCKWGALAFGALRGLYVARHGPRRLTARERLGKLYLAQMRVTLSNISFQAGDYGIHVGTPPRPCP